MALICHAINVNLVNTKSAQTGEKLVENGCMGVSTDAMHCFSVSFRL